jgi:hypothetical protein
MIAAQPGGCNAAVVHTTHGLAVREEDGSGHQGKGRIGQERPQTPTDWPQLARDRTGG